MMLMHDYSFHEQHHPTNQKQLCSPAVILHRQLGKKCCNQNDTDGLVPIEKIGLIVVYWATRGAARARCGDLSCSFAVQVCLLYETTIQWSLLL